jgi:predicted SprT family Zn-dependent metalloprotease
MTPRPAPCIPPFATAEQLQQHWADLNGRYFRGGLPSIDIVWSRRLTASAGMFVSRLGPRTRAGDRPAQQRCIRLSAPLLLRDPARSGRDLLGTLAHEMIHQWQFDVLKRRPNHGPDFSHKMEIMNCDGLGITIRHDLAEAVRTLSKYAWRCLRCGRMYERQRRTIRPDRHQCGACRGALREVEATKAPTRTVMKSPAGIKLQADLPLTFL